METLIPSLRVWNTWKQVRKLTVVAVYEDVATGTRVEDFCRGLVRDLGNRCDLSRQMWLVSELRLTKLRAIAATEAAAADMIVIAVHHAEALPDEVRSWLTLWHATRRTRPAVLVALFDPLFSGSSSGIQTYLKETAKAARADFVAYSDESAEART